jgi:hypothetical protein
MTDKQWRDAFVAVFEQPLNRVKEPTMQERSNLISFPPIPLVPFSSVATEHMELCHSDGSVCEDGCSVSPLPDDYLRHLAYAAHFGITPETATPQQRAYYGI